MLKVTTPKNQANIQTGRSPHRRQQTIDDIELKKLMGGNKTSRRESQQSIKDPHSSKQPAIAVKSQNQAKEIKSKQNAKEQTPHLDEGVKQREFFYLPRSLLITAFSEKEKEFPNIPSIHPTKHRTPKYESFNQKNRCRLSP